MVSKKYLGLLVGVFLLGTRVHTYGEASYSATKGIYVDYWTSDNVGICHDVGLELVGDVGLFKDAC